MVDESVLKKIEEYLTYLPSIGVHPRKAVLYGSFARGEEHEWSDIALVIIAPESDREFEHSLVEDLWEARGKFDVRIEPIPCGEKE